MTDRHLDRTRWDAVVVGAGLAGLACAQDLLAAGLSVRLLEAGDRPGGRMRTDLVSGCTIDAGFQVFNTSYPQVRRRVELARLRLRPFTPGFLLHDDGGRRLRFADPTRAPRQAVEALSGRLAGPRDLVALAALTGRDTLAPAALIKRGREATTREALSRAGFTPGFVERFFRPFLSGVFLEAELDTSSRFFHLVWRSMARGTLCLPLDGIGAVPRLLAAGLEGGTLVLDTPVTALTDEGVLLGADTAVSARAVVVATGPGAATHLLPGLTVPPSRTVTTYYHLAARSPLGEPTLMTDTRRRFVNTCVLSEVHPEYAPRGHALVATSVLGDDGSGREAAVRTALAECYGTDSAAWDLIATRTVPEALPAMPPPLPLSRSPRVGPRRYVCGDHRATGSVQGALASGARAARAVAADLAQDD